MKLLEQYTLTEETYYNLKNSFRCVKPDTYVIGERNHKYVIMHRTGSGLAVAWLEENLFFYYENEPALIMKAI